MVVFTVFIAAGLEPIYDFTVEEGSKGIITITLPYATVVAIDDVIEIKTDGTTWIKGKVWRRKIKRRGMTNTKVITCYGKTHTLYEKYCLDFGFHQYFNKDVGWIANDLIDHYFNGILTSVNVNVATGVVLTHFECDGRSVGDALEILATRGDCNFYVDNDDDAHFFIRPGAASGLTAEDLGELKIVDESGRKFVKVIVRGRHRAIQASAGAGYPEFFYQDDRIISTAEAGEVAAALVAELGAARQVVTAREDSFMETRAGKTIILNVPADGFNNQVIEIQRIRWVCKPPNLNQTYFTLGDKEPTIDSVLAKMARGVEWLPDVQVPRGAAFPTDPFDDMAFMLTGDVVVPGDYYGAVDGVLYTWDATNSVWKRPPCHLGLRAEPPAGGEVTGDSYVSTADGITYQWSGIAWVQTAQPTLADATDFGTIEWTASTLKKGVQPFDSAVFFYAIRAVATPTDTFAVVANDGASGKGKITGPNNTFDDFTAGDKLLIQHSEEGNDTKILTVDSVDGVNGAWIKTSAVLANDVATDESIVVSVMDAVKWVGDTPAVWFSDGTNQNIDAGSEQGIGLGASWIYFSAGSIVSATLTITNVYANGVGDEVGIICRVEVTADQEPMIMPVYSRGGNMTLDFLGAGVVDTLVLTSNEIYGKDIGTRASTGVTSPGIRMIGDAANIIGSAIGDTIAGNFTPGIWGFRAGPERSFWIDPAAGVYWTYGTGMFGVKTSPGIPPGEAGDRIVGYLDGTTLDLGLGEGDQLALLLRYVGTDRIVGLQSGTKSFWLDEATGNIIVDDAWDSFIPQTDAAVTIGNGTNDFVLHLAQFAANPGLAVNHPGKIVQVRAALADGEVRASVQNAAGNWNWINLGGPGAGAFLPLAGGVMAGDIDFGGNKAIDVSHVQLSNNGALMWWSPTTAAYENAMLVAADDHLYIQGLAVFGAADPTKGFVKIQVEDETGTLQDIVVFEHMGTAAIPGEGTWRVYATPILQDQGAGMMNVTNSAWLVTGGTEYDDGSGAEIHAYGKTHGTRAGNFQVWVPDAAGTANIQGLVVSGVTDDPRLYIPDSIRHLDDVGDDNYIFFSDDYQAYVVGGVNMIELTEAVQDLFIINKDGVDVDFSLFSNAGETITVAGDTGLMTVRYGLVLTGATVPLLDIQASDAAPKEIYLTDDTSGEIWSIRHSTHALGNDLKFLFDAGGGFGSSLFTISSAGITALIASGDLDIGAYEFRAKTFRSDIATGVAPLIVASTTKVINLNADYLDGHTSSMFNRRLMTADLDANGWDIDNILECKPTVDGAGSLGLTGTRWGNAFFTQMGITGNIFYPNAGANGNIGTAVKWAGDIYCNTVRFKVVPSAFDRFDDLGILRKITEDADGLWVMPDLLKTDDGFFSPGIISGYLIGVSKALLGEIEEVQSDVIGTRKRIEYLEGVLGRAGLV